MCWDDIEAIEQERLDADIQMAEWAAEAAYYAARRKRGICDHVGSGLGHKSPSFYSAADIVDMLAKGDHGNREGFVGEQSDIGEGNTLCLECGKVYPDPFYER